MDINDKDALFDQLFEKMCSDQDLMNKFLAFTKNKMSEDRRRDRVLPSIKRYVKKHYKTVIVAPKKNAIFRKYVYRYGTGPENKVIMSNELQTYLDAGWSVLPVLTPPAPAPQPLKVGRVKEDETSK